MNLETIHEEWSVDSKIEFNQLDVSSMDTPRLHAKYLKLYSDAKLKLKHSEMQQQILLKNKFLWYNGKMHQGDIERLGWNPDPFDGLKIMKGDFSYYYDSDPEIQTSEAKLSYIKETVNTLKEIIESLKWRHTTISNMIRYRQFEAGF